MNFVQAKVELVASTPSPLQLIHAALRQSHSYDPDFDPFKRLTDKDIELIHYALSEGHLSAFEHVSFTFKLSGISRTLSHQLVRHRIASYTQQSQRYVVVRDFDVVVPRKVYNNERARAVFEKAMQAAIDAYDEIGRILGENGDTHTLDAARSVLPNATATEIVVTMNVRSLLNFFKWRCTEYAEEEIRTVAEEMFLLCRKVLPDVFRQAAHPSANRRFL
jgi:thymidylate synthase (FAD)